MVLRDKSRIPFLGVGCIAISIRGRLLYFRKVYYVPDLQVPLYSLCIYRRLPGCGHFANNGGFSVTFPTFDLEVDDEKISTSTLTLSISPLPSTTSITFNRLRKRLPNQTLRPQMRESPAALNNSNFYRERADSTKSAGKTTRQVNWTPN